MAEEVERRLAAILSADAVGYSRLISEDEDATVHTITVYREQIAILVEEHHGRGWPTSPGTTCSPSSGPRATR